MISTSPDSNSYVIINTKKTCKDQAMDWIETEMKSKGYTLRAMEFDHTDDTGHQHFRVVVQELNAMNLLRSA